MNVANWLLDSDPAIRWQVLRDLVQAPVERAKLHKTVAGVFLEGVSYLFMLFP